MRYESSAVARWSLAAIVLLAIAIRLPGLGRPLLGHYDAKQVVNAMIARNLVRGEAAVCMPTLDLLRGGRPSVQLLDFPLPAYLAGAAWAGLGGSLDTWGRAVGMLFGVASVVILYRFAARRHGTAAATGAAFTMAIAPVSIFVGQAFLAESFLVCFSIVAVAASARYARDRDLISLVVLALSVALLLLTKAYMMVILIPIVGEQIAGAGRSATAEASPSVRRRLLRVGLACAVGCLPMLFWVGRALVLSAPSHPMAAHLFDSLRKSGTVYQVPDPLLLSTDFYRDLVDRIAGWLLTPIGLAFLVVGTWDRHWRRYLPWLGAVLLLVVLMPRKFDELIYYYALMLPPCALVIGIAWRRLTRRLRPGPWAVGGLVLVVVAFALRSAVTPCWSTPLEDRAVVAAARATRAYCEPGERVVTVHGTSLDLLYYCDRPGWAVPPDKLPARLLAMTDQGASLVVVVGGGAILDAVAALDPLRPLERGDGYQIFRITRAGRARIVPGEEDHALSVGRVIRQGFSAWSS